MKNKLMFLCLFFTCFFKSQNKDDDYKRLLDSAIVIKFNSLGNKGSYFLLNADNSKYTITETLSKGSFQSLDIYDKKNKSLLKKGLNVWKVMKVLNGNKITINIIDFKVTYKNKNYQFTNDGGSLIVFEYSCVEEKWKLLSESNIGI